MAKSSSKKSRSKGRPSSRKNREGLWIGISAAILVVVGLAGIIIFQQAGSGQSIAQALPREISVQEAADMRAQGAFVGDEEITGIVNHITDQNGGPVFDEQFQKNIESGDDGGSAVDGEWDDELVPDAIEVIRTSKRASTSMLQRRLKIGYNRAARIMEILEAEGMVGPENGSSPREILMDLDL